MKTPFDVCIQRRKERDGKKAKDSVVKTLNKFYEEPTLDEGWSEIIYHEVEE